MKKKITPASAEPVEEAIVPVTKPRTRKKTAEPAAVETPAPVAHAEATIEAEKPRKARAPRKKKSEESEGDATAATTAALAIEEVQNPAAKKPRKPAVAQPVAEPEAAQPETDELDEAEIEALAGEDEDERGEEHGEDLDELALEEALNEIEALEQSEDETLQTGERPEPKLERLQKILSMAGVASRRHAEELITEGRVQVNGETVTTLGAKADLHRDHIRVDGKLLQGVERHRYFLLNKPKGYVTTVSDPEGRPTVMQLFDKAGERLYPVGRLDFLSEGLLLITNDGELANLLTKAGSGVEKTYLVKVSGQPTEEELDELRKGVQIERAEPGSARIRTAPARVRQVREGDNPWFEVVLIEGRNRELRKMFTAIGHFVEKIRRVAYGPLTLDVEPGKFRELEPIEVEALKLTAEGKLKPRRIKSTRMLPKEAGRAVDHEAAKFGRRGGKFGGRSSFGPRTGDRPFRGSSDRPAGPAGGGNFRPSGDRPFRPREDRGSDRGPDRGFDRGYGRPQGGDRPSRPRFDRPEGGERPFRGSSDRPARPAGGSNFRPSGDRPFRPREDRGSDRGFDRGADRGSDRGADRGSGRGFDRPQAGDRPSRPRFDRPEGGERPFRGGSRSAGKPFGGKPAGSKPFGGRPSGGGRPGGGRSGGGFKPRPGGGRPSGGAGRRPSGGGGRRG